MEKRLIILIFLRNSYWIICRKFKNFDRNFCPVFGLENFWKYRWKKKNKKIFWWWKILKKFWCGKNFKNLGWNFGFFWGWKIWENLGVFWGLGIGKILGLLWMGYGGIGAGLAGLRIFWFFVFFGVFGFLVVFDIYVWRYKFFLLGVYVELLERRLIILVFLALSYWIIGRKCKNFDGNFGPVWSFFEIFAISLKKCSEKKFFPCGICWKIFGWKFWNFVLVLTKSWNLRGIFTKSLKTLQKWRNFFLYR